MKAKSPLPFLATLCLPFLIALPLFAEEAESYPSAAESWPVPPLSLHVSGNQILNSEGQEVILRGMSLIDLATMDSGIEGCPGAIEMIDRMTDRDAGWHTNTLRLVIHPDGLDAATGRWPDVTPETYYEKTLRPAIDRCAERGVYAIIDWHYVNDSTGKDLDGGDILAKTTAFWDFIAPRFKNDPHVLFELFNEPIDLDLPEPRWAHWKARAQPWVDMIRGHGADNIILVGGPIWSQEIGASAIEPFTGGNIAYVTHMYTNTGGGSLDWPRAQAQAAALKAPVILGEFGWDPRGDGPLQANPDYPQQIKQMVDFYRMGFLGWCASPHWLPGFLEADWKTVRKGPYYHGEFLKAWIQESWIREQAERGTWDAVKLAQ